MHPLIKWPGGKSGEISKIEGMVPSFDRYVEPFFGGGALFFHLQPERAIINDISSHLMEYYALLKSQDRKLLELLRCYGDSFSNLIRICEMRYDDIFSAYHAFESGEEDKASLLGRIASLTPRIVEEIQQGFPEKLLLSEWDFMAHINKMVVDKMARTVNNAKKAPFSEEDLKDNLITGFASGYYMYFRKIFNDINLHRMEAPSLQYKIANFYFVREFCYGSMFRYNKKGEFNIPYGGMSYNGKNFIQKVENMFQAEVESVFRNTEIHCEDFEELFENASLTARDFMFLDPPYDTNFSNYEGKEFTSADQERLAHALRRTPARFLLVIKNTDFIYGLYEGHFNIVAFDNQYTYNVRSRNDRQVEHLIITNLPVN